MKIGNTKAKTEYNILVNYVPHFLQAEKPMSSRADFHHNHKITNSARQGWINKNKDLSVIYLSRNGKTCAFCVLKLLHCKSNIKGWRCEDCKCCSTCFLLFVIFNGVCSDDKCSVMILDDEGSVLILDNEGSV